jgi:hypothetical protein
MNKEKLANLLAEKMAIVVMDKATLDALKAAEKEGNPVKIWFATKSAEAWLEVRKEKMKNLEAEVAEVKLDLIAECEKMGKDPNDFGLFDEVKINFKEKEGK